MRTFGERMTDFGQNEAHAPKNMRFIPVEINGVMWRVQLFDDEPDTPEMQEAIAQSADAWITASQIDLELRHKTLNGGQK